MAGLHLIMVMLLLAPGSVDGLMNESEKQAIVELTKLGAEVVFKSPANDPKAAKVLSYVLIDKNWKGGDEGLNQIEDLPKLATLYIMGNPKISDERLEELKKLMPDLAIKYRSTVVLGISPSNFPEIHGCLIVLVKAESPAAKAGLTVGDVIKQFDGKMVRDFDDVVKELSRKEPDDEVSLTVLRQGKEIRVKVKLGGWLPEPTQPESVPKRSD